MAVVSSAPTSAAPAEPSQRGSRRKTGAEKQNRTQNLDFQCLCSFLPISRFWKCGNGSQTYFNISVLKCWNQRNQVLFLSRQRAAGAFVSWKKTPPSFLWSRQRAAGAFFSWKKHVPGILYVKIATNLVKSPKIPPKLARRIRNEPN